jgi:hypothetical protein
MLMTNGQIDLPRSVNHHSLLSYIIRSSLTSLLSSARVLIDVSLDISLIKDMRSIIIIGSLSCEAS